MTRPTAVSFVAAIGIGANGLEAASAALQMSDQSSICHSLARGQPCAVSKTWVLRLAGHYFFVVTKVKMVTGKSFQQGFRM